MRIPCPYCGTRSNDEFTVMGDATAYMARPAANTLVAFHEYAYVRDNTAGEHRELWHHTAGCKQWLVVTRNTLTHVVVGVSAARDVKRDGGAA
jgi:methylglutamate dehydrogenase subunit B